MNVGCNERDRETLEIFKRSIEDPSKLLSSWSTEQDCCHWFGVHCDNLTRRVTKLDLSRNYSAGKRFGGQINMYVLKLEFLTFLDLHYNDFNAIYVPPIHNPSMISTIHHGANFSNLVYLDLSHNYGLKIYDLRWVSQLSSLEYIDLSYADLSEETLWLQRVNTLHSLRELRLSDCLLGSIQPSLEHANNSSSLEILGANFSNLVYLDLSDNYGLKIDDLRWISRLSSLEYIDLSNVDLSEETFWLQRVSSLPSLSELRLSNCSLKSIQLSHVLVNSSSPAVLGGNFSSLVYLDFSQNYDLIINDLRWVSRLSSLTYLNLSNADLSEEALWLQRVNSLPSLRELRLSDCSLKSIQPSLEHVNSSSLEVLDISRNDFHSEVPKWLFNLSSSISSLDLSFNYLKGHLPDELSNFRKLRSLVLRTNNFGGSIPEWLGQYKQLEHLDLSGNYFSGPIPETLVNISSLAYLHVGCNLLNGSLPKSLGQHSELQLFHAGSNLLSGSISPFFCQAMTRNTKLMALRLSHNHFSGSIPPQICQLPSLLILDLANNKLSGSIPTCLANTATFSIQPLFSHYHDHKRIGQDSSRSYGEYQHLIYRDCSESDDSLSVIVDDIVSSIDLSMNSLSGTIPPELFRLRHLLHLNLSHNGLTGSIPDEIGHMESLEQLDLSRNQLVGEIPRSF
ncbi:receptor-like protein EIX1 [Neltuma alba]|uniref:receptor-like protein EIX1 n=1 Tax=Neltuma alba TaxID=207710 RepID=UPI0010A38305|nr:receptor-like protein EIX1 [Prosopis alba]